MDDCLFTKCEATYWGNGLSLWKLPSINGRDSNSNSPPVSSRCRFVYNDFETFTSGAIYYRPINGEHTLKENLYVSNHAYGYGGAIEFNGEGSYEVTKAVFYFSFFSDNHGDGKGDDVILVDNIKYTTVMPFSHSFSATHGNRVIIYPSADRNDWLPLGTLSYLKIDGNNDNMNTLSGDCWLGAYFQ